MEEQQGARMQETEDRLRHVRVGDGQDRRAINRMISPGPECVFGLDMTFQGLKSLSPSLFLLNGIKELLLNNNELESIPRDICQLRSLERLNLAFNRIRSIPPELGRMVWLRELHLNDNSITTVPMELGGLHGLEVFNMHNNPLVAPFNTLSRERSLVHFCRENNTAYASPADRAWVDTVLSRESGEPFISVGTYNILCNYFASKCTYAPSWVLNADLRKETVLQNIISYNVDILALQEIETCSYFEFYREQLETRLNYESAFLPRGRALLLSDKRTVDGCAIFWKRGKFKLVEQVGVDFYQKITTDIRFSMNQDILQRHARKDNVALIAVLQQAGGALLIVANAHLFWDPEYSDVKLFQTILFIEEIEKIKGKYKDAPTVLLGDFNSLRGSYVYDLIVERCVNGHDFNLYDYSPFSSGFSHSCAFYDAYAGQDLTFTNFTPTFREVIDYIFYSDGLSIVSVLSPVEDEYTEKTVGLPNIHFPSDHIFIGARLCFSPRL
ncbi:CCR4-NOT transcription complex subunit 6 [Pancytospora philotis]|nr:CCR4-NOT transcription complex subunit 6 [Pancytospora philotis]